MSVTNVTGAQSDRNGTPAPSNVPVTGGYRAGILGTGFMGGVHARAIRVSGGVVVGVASADLETAAAAAAQLGVERAFADAQQLVESDLIDVVHVCTPNNLHAPLALAALRAGKHVVCEKPLATSVEDAEALVAAARETGRVATVPFVYRFHPMVREAREMVRSGGIGRVTLAHGSYLQDWLTGAEDDNWRVDATLGGPSRAFGDIGSHWCDLLEFVTGDRIRALSARTATVNAERAGGTPVRTEDVVTFQFETEAGVPGAATISQISPGRKNRLLLEVSGSEGTLTFDQERPEELWHGRRDSSRALIRDPQALSPAAARYTRLPAGHAQGYQDCFDHFVGDTAAAVRGDAPEGLPTFDDGLRAAHIADTVLRSAGDGGAWVEVPA